MGGEKLEGLTLIMRKKTYIQPGMDREEVVIFRSLLTESLDIYNNEGDDEVDDFGDLLGKSRWDENPEESMNLW